MRDETIAIHGGYHADGTRAVAVPIYQTVSHEFESAAQAGAIFDLEEPGFHYNRINNPTNSVLEARLAELERGTAAVTCSSGMAAVSGALTTVATMAGDNLVCAPQLYGATYTWLAHVLPKQGIEVRFGRDDHPESLRSLIDSRTRAVYCETVGNPAGNIVDLERVADAAHAAGVPLIVDNTVPTPVYLKPLRWGADIVVHSLTKFIGGHGTTIGGAIVDGGGFPWLDAPDRFPGMTRPEPAFHGVVYARDFPQHPFATRFRTVCLRNLGATLSPFNSFLLIQGLETLSLRLERHEQNARAVADYLARDSRVAWVSFSGFPDDPQYRLAQKYLDGHATSMLTFGVRGGYEAGIRFFDSVKLFKRLVNLGDAKSLVAHPASTTHRQLTPTEHKQVGISPEMIRLSVGIEHIDDLLEDLDQALHAAAQPARSTAR